MTSQQGVKLFFHFHVHHKELQWCKSNRLLKSICGVMCVCLCIAYYKYSILLYKIILIFILPQHLYRLKVCQGRQRVEWKMKKTCHFCMRWKKGKFVFEMDPITKDNCYIKRKQKKYLNFFLHFYTFVDFFVFLSKIMTLTQVSVLSMPMLLYMLMTFVIRQTAICSDWSFLFFCFLTAIFSQKYLDL